MYFNYKLQTNYFCQGHKIQNTKNFKSISNTRISITCISISKQKQITFINPTKYKIQNTSNVFQTQLFQLLVHVSQLL